MRKNHLFIIFTLALIVSMVLGACAVPPPPPAGGDTGASADTAAAEEEGPTAITWAMWGSPAEIATHQAVADAFMESHPDIEIEILSEPWADYFTKVQTLWASGDSSQIPDVLFLSPIIRYAEEGVLENLDPFIETAGYDLEDYWPSLLDFATFEGSIYGFPRDVGLEVLYYNKEIFDEVGVPYPDETWTWQDLLDAAEQLADIESSGRVNRYALGMEGGKYQLWVGQNGGSILDDMTNPSECTLDEPEAVAAIQFFADMMNNDYAMRPSNLSQAGGDAGVFANGQVAMIIQNASRVSQFNEAGLNYDVAVVPIPDGGQRAGSAAGAAWVMSAGSDNKDEAWTFLSWLQSTDGGQYLYTQSGEILPALQSTARSDAFLDSNAPPVNREAFIIEGENAKVGRAGYFPEWSELQSSIINPNLDQIWTGDASPEEVLPVLCEQVDTFLADNGFPK